MFAGGSIMLDSGRMIGFILTLERFAARFVADRGAAVQPSVALSPLPNRLRLSSLRTVRGYA